MNYTGSEIRAARARYAVTGKALVRLLKIYRHTLVDIENNRVPVDPEWVASVVSVIRANAETGHAAA